MDRSCYKRQATICGKHRLKSVQAASDRRPPPLQPGQNNKELSRLWRHFSFYPVSVQEAQDFFFKSCRLRGKEGVMVWDFLKCSVDLGKLKDLKGMGNRGPWSLKAEFLRQNDPSLPETNRQEPLFGGGGNSLCLGPYCFPGGSVVKKTKKLKNLPANAGDAGSIPRSGRFSGGGNGNPLQYSYLENSTDRGVSQAVVHGVLKSRTWLTMHVNTGPLHLQFPYLVMVSFL